MILLINFHWSPNVIFHLLKRYKHMLFIVLIVEGWGGPELTDRSTVVVPTWVTTKMPCVKQTWTSYLVTSIILEILNICGCFNHSLKLPALPAVVECRWLEVPSRWSLLDHLCQKYLRAVAVSDLVVRTPVKFSCPESTQTKTGPMI